ncbi:probable inactive tRNA-specific adenosine deaminase-like protein 3 [Condylostylus longicornis]|uniref:probable inactive tRNA-specific adenosine deaminase-like protein 3 n=1 Tax=Condylostylus longicornis TaxID=2530218 RepID=UPI00244DB669|nr:probable inactive tRNA-specific adenosine deaminase-like protein 3 [Condylostylus longicornis]
MEPNKKRLKLDNIKINIKSILSDDFLDHIPLEAVYVASIAEKKQFSSLIFELNKYLPFDNLSHLKRIRKNDVIICKLNDLITFTSEIENECHLKSTIEDLNLECNEILDILRNEKLAKIHVHRSILIGYLKAKGISDNGFLQKLCDDLKIVDIPSKQSLLRWQYEEMNKIWPCKFHPNKQMELLHKNENFTSNELIFHQTIIMIIKKIMNLEKNLYKNVGICVDPRTNSVVAMSTNLAPTQCGTPSSFHINEKIKHCPILLIDFVARTQNGGIWKYENIKFLENTNDEKEFCGILKEYVELLRCGLGDEQIGAQKININNQKGNSNKIIKEMVGNVPNNCNDFYGEDEQNNLEKYGPYLCTGYDIYFLKEPCLMCAMALIHSRARRIFFVESTNDGALKTCTKLHTAKGLNHHYEVFQCSIID